MTASPEAIKRASQMFLLGVTAVARSRQEDASPLLEKVASAAPRLRDQAERAVLGTCLFLDALQERIGAQAA